MACSCIDVNSIYFKFIKFLLYSLLYLSLKHLSVLRFSFFILSQPFITIFFVTLVLCISTNTTTQK